MRPANRSNLRASKPILCTIAIFSIAAPCFHGCAGSFDAAVAERAADDGLPAAELAGELSAIEGTKVERTGVGVEVTLDSDTIFGNDSAMLTLESERTVEELAAVLLRYPGTRIAVSAHTDSVGPDDYQTAMTERQAFSIGGILVDMGVPPSRIETAGFGDVHPAAPNSTAAGRRANRRVTIAILPEAAAEKR